MDIDEYTFEYSADNQTDDDQCPETDDNRRRDLFIAAVPGDEIIHPECQRNKNGAEEQRQCAVYTGQEKFTHNGIVLLYDRFQYLNVFYELLDVDVSIFHNDLKIRFII
ncbi:MAG: hypothetical protein HZC28_14880 [Spirochaetes bacterium]|nr:hypothetical protein [Spirochaetota bacterium]